MYINRLYIFYCFSLFILILCFTIRRTLVQMSSLKIPHPTAQLHKSSLYHACWRRTKETTLTKNGGNVVPNGKMSPRKRTFLCSTLVDFFHLLYLITSWSVFTAAVLRQKEYDLTSENPLSFSPFLMSSRWKSSGK